MCLCLPREGRIVCCEGRLGSESLQPRVEWNGEGGGDSGTVSVRACQKIDCYIPPPNLPSLGLAHSRLCCRRDCVSESQINVVYKVDNRTGPLVDVKKWLDNQELEEELNLRAECR